MNVFLGITNSETVVIQWVVVIGASLFAAVHDLRERRIPNSLTFPVFVAGLIWASWFGGISGLAEAAGACALLALPYVILFLFFGGGAGDAKLMGAIGAWLGFRQGITVFVCVAIAGGGLAIAKAIAQKRLKYLLISVFVSFYGSILYMITHRTMKLADEQTDIKQSGDLDIPYGVAIFAGVCAGGGVVWLT